MKAGEVEEGLHLKVMAVEVGHYLTALGEEA